MKRHGRALVLLLILGGGAAAWISLQSLEESYGERPYHQIEPGLYLGMAVQEPPPGTHANVKLCGREDAYELDAQLWAPIFEAGSKEPDLDWVRRVVGFIEEQRRASRQVYVHCLNGVNRSAGAVAAYLMKEHGWGRDRALAYLRAKRPIVQPNLELMSLLAEWEQTLEAKESR